MDLGSYDLLATTILTSNTTSVTFSSLNTLAAGYQHLQIRATVRSSTGGNGAESILLTFNGDSTAANFRAHSLQAYAGSLNSNTASGQAGIFMRDLAVRDGAGANIYEGLVLDLLDAFESTKNTTARWLGGSTFTDFNGSFNGNIQLGSGLWLNTASLTSVTLSTTFKSGSRFSLYGLRK
jgi:hypothetical protein